MKFLYATILILTFINQTKKVRVLKSEKVIRLYKISKAEKCSSRIVIQIYGSETSDPQH